MEFKRGRSSVLYSVFAMSICAEAGFAGGRAATAKRHVVNAPHARPLALDGSRVFCATVNCRERSIYFAPEGAKNRYSNCHERLGHTVRMQILMLV